MYSSHRDQRESLKAEIEASLRDVAPALALAALRDWHADLSGRVSDPDPGTDAAASLADRLRRQTERGLREANPMSAENA